MGSSRTEGRVGSHVGHEASTALPLGVLGEFNSCGGLKEK